MFNYTVAREIAHSAKGWYIVDTCQPFDSKEYETAINYLDMDQVIEDWDGNREDDEPEFKDAPEDLIMDYLKEWGETYIDDFEWNVISVYRTKAQALKGHKLIMKGEF